MDIVAHDGANGKVCKRCQTWLELGQFGPNKKTRDGFEGVCKKCRKPRHALVVHEERDGVIGKTCSVCTNWKPLSEFGKNRYISDGLNYRCRQCHNEHTKQQWLKDPVAWNERNKASYRKNAEARCETVRQYREGNLERVQEYDRKRNKIRYALHPEERLIHTKIRRDRIRAANATGGEYTPQDWFDLLDKYNHTCLRCGKRPPEIRLTPDHIVPIAKGGSNTIDNIQPLCGKCNRWKWAKTIDFRPDYQPQP